MAPGRKATASGRNGRGVRHAQGQNQVTRKKNGVRRSRRQIWLTKSLKQRVSQEASKFGLSPSEYLSMAVSISESFRQALPENESINMKSVARIIDSPIWGIVMGSIGPTISRLLEQDSNGKSENSSKATPKQNATIPTPMQKTPPVPGTPPIGVPRNPTIQPPTEGHPPAVQHPPIYGGQPVYPQPMWPIRDGSAYPTW